MKVYSFLFSQFSKGRDRVGHTIFRGSCNTDDTAGILIDKFSRYIGLHPELVINRGNPHLNIHHATGLLKGEMGRCRNDDIRFLHIFCLFTKPKHLNI